MEFNNLDWVMPLDALASNGVIDYDAAADILGEPPRYFGHPEFESVPQLLPKGTTPQKSPESDIFQTSDSDNSLVKNPTWKKWAFGGFIATAIIGTALAIATKKGKIDLSKIKNSMTNFNLGNIGTKLKNFGTSALNIIKKPFSWLASKLHRTSVTP